MDFVTTLKEESHTQQTTNQALKKNQAFSNLKFKKSHNLDFNLCKKFELLKENSPKKTSNGVFKKICRNPK